MTSDQSFVDRLFEERIRPLPATDRLRIAALILQEYVATAPTFTPVESIENYRDEWSEEDLREASLASWTYVSERCGW